MLLHGHVILIVSVLLSLFIHCQGGGIDFGDCTTAHGHDGKETYCPANHVAVGACASGNKGKCSGPEDQQSHSLKCCRLNYGSYIANIIDIF